MIVRMTEAMKISDRWFLLDDEYILYDEMWIPSSACDRGCDSRLSQLSNPFYRVLIKGLLYNVPQFAAALLPGDIPKENKGGRLKRMIREFYTVDVTAKLFGGHTDVVKSAKKFLDLDIRQKAAFNLDVNQYGIRELREYQRSKVSSNEPPDVSIPKEENESGGEIMDPDATAHN